MPDDTIGLINNISAFQWQGFAPFTVSGVFSTPERVNSLLVFLIGGGAGGGQFNAGGQGGYLIVKIKTTPGEIYVVTIGGGSTGSSGGGGNPGGATSFGLFLKAGGGQSGNGSPGPGGVNTIEQLNSTIIYSRTGDTGSSNGFPFPIGGIPFGAGDGTILQYGAGGGITSGGTQGACLVVW